jgi:hypothetical protein
LSWTLGALGATIRERRLSAREGSPPGRRSDRQLQDLQHGAGGGAPRFDETTTSLPRPNTALPPGLSLGLTSRRHLEVTAMQVPCPACGRGEIDFGDDGGPVRIVRRVRTCRRCGAFVVLDERTRRIEVIRPERTGDPATDLTRGRPRSSGV